MAKFYNICVNLCNSANLCCLEWFSISCKGQQWLILYCLFKSIWDLFVRCKVTGTSGKNYKFSNVLEISCWNAIFIFCVYLCQATSITIMFMCTCKQNENGQMWCAKSQIIEMFSDYTNEKLLLCWCYQCLWYSYYRFWELIFKRSCYLGKILWSWAWPQQTQFFYIHLICAVVTRMSFLNPKLCLRLLAALFNLQMVLPHPPWHLHEQKQAPWLFSRVSAFYLSPSLVRNTANVKAALGFFCSLTVVAGLSISVSVTDGGRQDVESPSPLVPCKGHVLCGLCSPEGIRMKRVACWAGHTLWKPVWPLVCASCFCHRNTPSFQTLVFIEKGWNGLNYLAGLCFLLDQRQLNVSICSLDVVFVSIWRGLVLWSPVCLTSEIPEHRAKVILGFKPSLESVSCPSHSSIPHDGPDDQKINE